ncbi:MAG: M15 family metallopeptidase [Ilumatobacter sp.]|uniref:M15 family metallopeptidase n=1 Tax=Ilumatobacter sp. TaxID=1967498 RepID=UPI00261995B9|nr:M15 family metallopeptidase [Ilumatobacter sp.]MDJ0770097.1 M15 family metallopeptidase [Ilumatobacter sp.]
MLRNLVLGGVIAATGVIAVNAPADVSATRELDDTPWFLPETPPRCTVEQADSGDVAGCLLAFWNDPSETGWGAPPAPGVGPGWEWSGYRYNESPALADWESQRIGQNAEAVAGRPAGTFETHVAAQALFEGFLHEIDAKGYRVRDASGYSFRCTSGNGGWDCPTRDPSDLSLHAYGLAVDMNAGTNPIRRYDRVDGLTACQTPIQTDLPRWVIQTAEKWGLYWGGYGWSRGCQQVTTERDSVFRDPPHFEFRGTVEQARAIAAFNLANDPSIVCLPMIDDDGDEYEQCDRTGRPDARTRMAVDVEPPSGAVAAMINLTAVDADWYGFLTLEDCGPQPTDRTTSALSFAPTDAVATMAVVPITDEGRFCVYRSTSVHSIVDVVGYLGADGEPLWFDPTTPTRLTDTREDLACDPLQECNDGPVPERGRHVVPVDDDRSRIANLTIVEAAGPGFAQAGQCDGVGADAGFSHLNVNDADPRANLVLIEGGTAGSCVFTLTQSHVIVDELGRLDAEAGYGWALRPATRALDTRECAEQWCEDRPEAGQVIRLDLGVEAPGAAVGITVTDADAPGYVSVGPCEAIDTGESAQTSNLNHDAGQTVTNLALVELDEGEMCIFTLASAHVIIDVQAELTTEQGVGLAPIAPTRFHDSRES